VIIVRRAGINDAPAYQSITYDNADRVATIASNRPNQRNGYRNRWSLQGLRLQRLT
jgi:1,4-dihydroxy-2-naphthoyl-CoA synthase